MNSSEMRQARTTMFARVLGPYFLIVPATIAARATYMETLLAEFGANPMWPWLYGAILLFSGLVIIAFHQHWRGAAAIMVSALGWFLFVRGVLLMTVPQSVTSVGESLTGPVPYALVRVFFVCLALVGLYLTYVGWIRDRPHASSG